MSTRQPDASDLPVDELRRIDEACRAFERAWQAGESPALDAYLTDGTAGGRRRLLLELLVLDIYYRRGRGDTPRPDEYRAHAANEPQLVDEAFELVDREPNVDPDPEHRTGNKAPELSHDPTFDAVSITQPAKSPASGPPATVPATHRRYRVQELLEEGGLGRVYLAQDCELNRVVALKEIRPEHADDRDRRSRFVFEAEVTGGLEHPGIVPVYGCGVHADGRPYYAMRFVRGGSLRESIRALHDEHCDNAASFLTHLKRLLARFQDVCHATAYAHSRGVVHRDIKPGNIMVGKYGETLLVDWGLAKAMHESSDHAEEPLSPVTSEDVAATRLGTAMGTPGYMSPEQAAGRIEQVDSRSDIYGLGATLYAVLTGHAPFERTHDDESKEELLRRIVDGVFPRPRQLNRHVPAALEAVCLRAMNGERADRYETALELASDIEAWLADDAVSAYADPWHEKTLRWVRRHRVWSGSAAAAVLVTLLLAPVIVLFVVKHRVSETFRLEEQARSADQNGRLEEAIPLLTRAIERGHPESDRLRLERAILWNALGEDAKCLAECQALADRDLSPRLRSQVRLWLAVGHFDKGQRRQGRENLQAALAGTLDEADRHFALGLTASNRHDALVEYRRAVDFNPLHRQALSRLLQHLILAGRLNEAREHVGRGMGISPHDVMYPATLPLLAAFDDDYELARRELERVAPRLDPATVQSLERVIANTEAVGNAMPNWFENQAETAQAFEQWSFELSRLDFLETFAAGVVLQEATMEPLPEQAEPDALDGLFQFFQATQTMTGGQDGTPTPWRTAEDLYVDTVGTSYPFARLDTECWFAAAMCAAAQYSMYPEKEEREDDLVRANRWARRAFDTAEQVSTVRAGYLWDIARLAGNEGLSRDLIDNQLAQRPRNVDWLLRRTRHELQYGAPMRAAGIADSILELEPDHEGAQQLRSQALEAAEAFMREQGDE